LSEKEPLRFRAAYRYLSAVGRGRFTQNLKPLYGVLTAELLLRSTIALFLEFGYAEVKGNNSRFIAYGGPDPITLMYSD